ncbi:twin-arginine translocation signal domain-containing protein [Halorarum salinum]|uniref:Twin-arginine translocation signal domain-containing protein n=1 Tax=Halorarum salinum TaxID=2743089 RepID=A0A7D5QE03_9EURY|nr:twin-arginine translocation signal domain-containing protein [Halobaculum salinum]QLG60363.1 twin-arginine translocation signal domain-containing protein [Halobaculum salinum]
MREMHNSRRSYLKAAGAAASVAILGGCIGNGTAEQSRGTPESIQEKSVQLSQDNGPFTDREEGFDEVIDIVEAGADDTGEESINPVLEEARGDDTLVKFPPGTYLLTDTVRFTGFSNFGLIGQDATIKIGPHRGFRTDVAFKFGVPYSPGNGLLVESLTFDQSEPGRGVKVIQASMDDGLRVRDIHHRR